MRQRLHPLTLALAIGCAMSLIAQAQAPAQSSGRGQYGAVDGLPRILRLLDGQSVPASFFIPAVSAALHPGMIKEIQSSGRHEIGVHGWIHERLPTPQR